MKNKFRLLIIIVSLVTAKTIAQPFVDIVNFSYQTFNTTYKYPISPYATIPAKNQTDNYFLNLFVPKEFKNGNTLLIRINSEIIKSSLTSAYDYWDTRQLASVSMPLGFQFVSKNKKWKTVTMVIPKIASDFRAPVNDKDFQLGGIVIENFQLKENIKIKAGLYYNNEAFGNFFIPLVGVDWKINKRIYLYGILPTNYKAEFNIIKNRLYTGLGFKSFTRSFRLSKENFNDYVRYDEEQIKLFVDYFVAKKILVYAEAGYTLGKSPIQYIYNTKEERYDSRYFNSQVYTSTEPYMIFNVGIAYRIRTDLEKKEEIK